MPKRVLPPSSMDTATPSLYKRRMLQCDAEYLSANGMHLTSEALGAWTTAMAMAPMTWHTVAWLQVLTEAIKADLQALTPGATSEAQLVDIANRIKRVQEFMRGHRTM